MSEYFESSFFKANRKKLIQSTGLGLIVIPANATLQRSGDSAFPFRQDSNFWYLTGVNEPDYVLVIKEREAYLIAPKLSDYQKVMESQVGRGTIRSISGIENILPAKEGWKKLSDDLGSRSKVGVLSPVNMKKHYAIYPNPARSYLLQRLKRVKRGLKFIDIRKELAILRMLKQPAELSAIQSAIDITSQTIQEVFSEEWYQSFKFEYEVEAAITAGFRKRGASGHAFTPIVISGAKTSSIHNYDSEGILEPGKIIQVDVGAEVSNYSADLSRVFPIGSKLSSRQIQIYETVKEVQEYATSLVIPGANIRENEKLIETFMGKKLISLGVISSATKSAIRARYPHSCSHMLGLDTHDAADYDLPLAKNMVLTVEPGIYIPEENIGIRIEDDLVVTDGEPLVLSKNLSR